MGYIDRNPELPPPFLHSIQHSWPGASGHPLLQQFLVFGEVIVPVCDK